MKIAFVTSEFVTEDNFDGGLANYIYRISLSLICQGHEPFVIVSSNKNEEFVYRGITVFRVNKANKFISIINLITLGLFSQTLGVVWLSYCLNGKLRNIQKLEKIDIVQYSSYLATGLFSITTAPTVVRLSGYQPLIRESYGITYPSLDTWLSEKFEEIAMKKVNSVYGPSILIANIVKKVIKKSVKVIESPFVLDVTDESLESCNKVKNVTSNYVLFFGSVGLLKGVKDIADVIHSLFTKEKELYFVFVGKDMGFDGGSMMSYVYRQAGEYSNRIMYFNKLRHDELYPLIRNASVTILPSRIENFPNTCIEAMALGQIVIGTKGTSMDQLITDGFNGLLCIPASPSSLKNTLLRFLKMSNKQKAFLKVNAKATVSRLEPKIIVSRLINYYEDVIRNYSEK